MSIYGDKDESFIVNYSGETLPFTVKSGEQFSLPNININNSPVKIVVNDNELEDKIILYKKIEIEDNNNSELDKDNLILNVIFQVTDDSFVYDPNSMTFSLISENLSIDSEECEEEEGFSFNSEYCDEEEGFYTCEFDLEKLGEGNYDLYFKDKNKCNYLYLVNSNYVTSLFPSFEIDDNNMINNSNSTLIFGSDMNLSKIEISHLKLTNNNDPNIIIEKDDYIIEDDYSIIFSFDFSNETNQIIEGLYTFDLNIRKNDETKTYSDTIEIKRACKQDNAEVNNGSGECKY